MHAADQGFGQSRLFNNRFAQLNNTLTTLAGQTVSQAVCFRLSRPRSRRLRH